MKIYEPGELESLTERGLNSTLIPEYKMTVSTCKIFTHLRAEEVAEKHINRKLL